MRAAHRAWPLLVAIASLSLSTIAAGGSMPDVTVSAGMTSSATGRITGGGLTSSLGLDWPVNDRVSFGVLAFADDIGTRRQELADPNDGTPLGSIAVEHRWTYGATWRTRVQLLAPDPGKWSIEWRAGWGYSRVEDDQRGRTFDAASAIGLSTGLGVFRRVGAKGALGLSTRIELLAIHRGPLDERPSRYTATALEWHWKAARD